MGKYNYMKYLLPLLFLTGCAFEGIPVQDLDARICPVDYVEFCQGNHPENQICECIERRELRRVYDSLIGLFPRNTA